MSRPVSSFFTENSSCRTSDCPSLLLPPTRVGALERLRQLRDLQFEFAHKMLGLFLRVPFFKQGFLKLQDTLLEIEP